MSKKNISITRGCNFGKDENSGESFAEMVKGAFKLNATDWIEKLKPNKIDKIYEVRFKNTRKGYFENTNELQLKVGDVVVVEGSPGHDVGIVALTGDMVSKQMRCKGFNPNDIEFKKIYRKAKSYDIERWQESIALEHPTMIRSRIIAAELNLNMKIGDVEFQGDKIKAIFYYIADVRVDFRELIKIFADEFRVRIEMKQIGARQEAGRIGGIGSCGRELCCSMFVTNFVSVTTNSARYQQIMLNPQKLAGQCGKLKCCLNFEVDSYIDARKGFPKINGPIQTMSQDYYHMKTDIFKGEMIFSTDPHLFVNTKTLSVDTVKEIISLNRRGIKVDEIISENVVVSDEDAPDYRNVVGDDSITRFDKKVVKKNKNRPNKNKEKGNNRPERPAQGKPALEQDKIVKEQSVAGSATPNLEESKNTQNRNRNNNNRDRNNRSERPAQAKPALEQDKIVKEQPIADSTAPNADRNRNNNNSNNNNNKKRPFRGNRKPKPKEE